MMEFCSSVIKFDIMKILRLATLCFIALGAFTLNGYSQVPSVDQIIISFFQKYDFTKKDPIRITFEKKRDGWYTAEEDVNVPPYRHTSAQLFWSKKTRSYIPLKYAKAVSVSRDSAKIRARHYMNDMGGEDYLQFQYARNVYFGYPGWDLDVIRDYGSKQNLNDTLLEGLGRAYSNYAIGFF